MERPKDHFRIIRFSDSTTEFAHLPLRVTPPERGEQGEALAWIRGQEELVFSP